MLFWDSDYPGRTWRIRCEPKGRRNARATTWRISSTTPCSPPRCSASDRWRRRARPTAPFLSNVSTHAQHRSTWELHTDETLKCSLPGLHPNTIHAKLICPVLLIHGGGRDHTCLMHTGNYTICLSFILATDDPPRPTFDSLLSRDMAGYMPARADFMEVRRAVTFIDI